jgi:hypothetical protein
MLFVAPRLYNLKRIPSVYTLVHARPQEYATMLGRLDRALRSEPPDRAALAFPGMADSAYQVLIEQGTRGGAILALERVVQSQAKCLRILLVVGEDAPEALYHFDLVGAYPRSDPSDPEAFYADAVHRIATAENVRSVSQHTEEGAPISREVWDRLEAPTAMLRAAHALNDRAFFTPMVRVALLVQVPAIDTSVASQYSEGCFGTWEPALNALVATITGSATPVNKGEITADDLAVIVGVRNDGLGALVRRVEGLGNHPPSSEAVEMMDMDDPLPRVRLDAWGGTDGPVVRSKLHGHRGIAAYDPAYVEYVPMAPAYQHYPVTCGSDAQARGIRDAFARAESLRNPDDPRQIAFTVLPGHGCMLVEKWLPGRAPFQVLWEAMDEGRVIVEAKVPQGPVDYVMGPDGRRILAAPVVC